MINSKIIFQCSKVKPPEETISKILEKLPGWSYIHFDDNKMIEFMQENYVEKFKNIFEIFSSYKRGQHRCDLFRYFYLYLNGGVYIDSDMMIEQNIDSILLDYDFVSILAAPSEDLNSNTVMNGFIACNKKNAIIHDALLSICEGEISEEDLEQDYFLICKKLGNIVESHKDSQKIMLYKENNFINLGIAVSTDDKKKPIATHYWKEKTIPENSAVNKSVSRSSGSILFPIDQIIDVDYRRFGSIFDGGYIYVNDFNKNDFVISCGIENNVDFELEVLQECFALNTYDNSIEDVPNFLKLDGVSFFKKTIGSDYNLEKMIEDTNHDGDLILKMDIEGGEWEVLKASESNQWERFRQVQIEFHNLLSIYKDPLIMSQHTQYLSKILKTHYISFVHVNNYGKTEVVNNFLEADVVEVLFLRKSDYKTNTSYQKLLDLTWPNYPYKPDMYIY